MQAPWPSAVLCSSHACVWWRQIFTVTVGRLWTNGCVWKWGMWVYSPQMAYQWNDDGLMINAVLRYPNVISTHTHTFWSINQCLKMGNQKNCHGKMSFYSPSENKKHPIHLEKTIFETNQSFIHYILYSSIFYHLCMTYYIHIHIHIHINIHIHIHINIHIHIHIHMPIFKGYVYTFT